MQVTAALDTAAAKYGRQVNVAVNCAGIGSAKKVLSASKTPEVGKSFMAHSLVSLSLEYIHIFFH